MKITSRSFARSNLIMNVAHVASAPVVEVDRCVHHQLILDFSYSMYGSLNRLANDCKALLRNKVRSGDMVSILYFSGRGQYGYILKNYLVDNAEHVKNMDKAIDNGFRPIGCTGFVEPLEEAVKNLNSVEGFVNSLMFMSDGYDNCWNTSKIIEVTEEVGKAFDNVAIVEYGWNANRNLLTQMARTIGASYVFAEDVVGFSRIMDDFIQSKPVSVPRIEISVGEAEGGVVYSVNDDILYEVKDGKALVPENAEEIIWLTTGKVSDVIDAKRMESELYGLMGAFATMMRPDVVYSLLAEIGDVRFVNEFTNCFGKQSYTEFKDLCDKARKNKSERFIEGQDFNAVPDENAFTVLDVINTLIEGGSKLVIGSDNFTYNRIAQATENAHSVDKERLAELSAKLAVTKSSSELKAIQEEIASLVNESKDLVFVRDTHEVSFSNVTFNSKRPNISGLVQIYGHVDIGENTLGLPEKLDTFVWRNYTIVCDGIVNMYSLPIKMNKETADKLSSNGVKFENPWIDEDSEVIVILKKMPIINRNMVKTVSAKVLFEKEVKLFEMKAFAKVYKEMRERIAPVNKSKGITETYGQEASDWLAERGLTDAGFSPKVVKKESEDFYLGKEIKVSLKGLSSLPKVEDVEKLIVHNANPANKPKKVNAASLMMIRALDSFNKVDSKVRKEWLETQTKLAIADKRELELEIAKEKFAVIVGQVWFPEFKSMDDNSLNVSYQYGKENVDVLASVELKEIEVKI